MVYFIICLIYFNLKYNFSTDHFLLLLFGLFLFLATGVATDDAICEDAQNDSDQNHNANHLIRIIDFYIVLTLSKDFFHFCFDDLGLSFVIATFIIVPWWLQRIPERFPLFSEFRFTDSYKFISCIKDCHAFYIVPGIPF